MKCLELSYKNITVKHYINLKAYEFCVKRNKIQDDKDFVMKFTEFIEFVEYSYPKVLIIKQIDSDYHITKPLYSFISKIYKSQLSDCHLEKLFIIHNNLTKGIKSFDNLEFCCDYGEFIKKVNNQNSFVNI